MTYALCVAKGDADKLFKYLEAKRELLVCRLTCFFLQDGMEVTFSEVVGMEELNDGRPRKVKNCKVRQ